MMRGKLVKGKTVKGEEKSGEVSNGKDNTIAEFHKKIKKIAEAQNQIKVDIEHQSQNC